MQPHPERTLHFFQMGLDLFVSRGMPLQPISLDSNSSFEMNLSYLRIDDDIVSEWVQLLRHDFSQHLRSLDLANNMITDAGATSIADALRCVFACVCISVCMSNSNSGLI
jgi:hypothetical protein